MFRQYLYISTAQNLKPGDVDDILASSERNNPARGITGLLLFNGRNFLQLLEGPQDTVVELISKISADPRHNGVSFVYTNDVSSRDCPNWAMKRVLIADSIDKRHEALSLDLPESINDQIRNIVLNFAVLN